MMADAIHDILTQNSQSASTTPQVTAQQENGVTTFRLPGTLREDSSHSESSDDIISTNSRQFKEYLAQFIETTNTTLNDLLQRVAALEAEQQSSSHHTP